jgi:hypothetical protein
MRFVMLLALASLPLATPAVMLNPYGIHGGVHMELEPFVASYDLERSGQHIGELTMTLSRISPADWLLVSETRIGATELREESRFALTNYEFISSTSNLRVAESRTTHYERFGSKQHRIEFDWAASEARATNEQGLFRYPLALKTIDHNLILLELGRTQRTYDNVLRVAGEQKTEVQHFEGRSGILELPTGPSMTIRFDRVDRPGTMNALYLPLMLVPVHVERRQENGDAIVMELTRLY